jgi:hypothetical protein
VNFLLLKGNRFSFIAFSIFNISISKKDVVNEVKGYRRKKAAAIKLKNKRANNNIKIPLANTATIDLVSWPMSVEVSSKQ